MSQELHETQALHAQLKRLHGALESHLPLAVAVSGGVDSMTLAMEAQAIGHGRVTMIHAVSPAVPARATALVREYAARHGWSLLVTDAGEFADPAYTANPVNRCYFCKNNLYDRIRTLTASTIAAGTNLDDLGDFRPGLLAARERGVVHPFVEAEIDKSSIRAIARLRKLDDLAELPAQPCLASRVETGIGIDANDLAFVDRVETALLAASPPGAVLRCRITHDGVVLEVDAPALARAPMLADLVRRHCDGDGRQFAGWRPYRRGAAFLHDAT